MKFTILALILTASTAYAEATFPGAEATNCDPEQFTPVYGQDGVTILYWNNPTCGYVGSGSSFLDVPSEE